MNESSLEGKLESFRFAERNIEHSSTIYCIDYFELLNYLDNTIGIDMSNMLLSPLLGNATPQG